MRVALTILLLAVSAAAQAQYKCVVAGRTVMQSEPCADPANHGKYRCLVNGQVVYQSTSCVAAAKKSEPNLENMTAQQLQAHFEREREEAQRAKRPVAVPPVTKPPAPAPAAVVEKHPNDPVWVARNEDMVRRRLRDPDSAKFRDSFVSRKSGAPLVCGFVNAKNAFGGYTGFQRFVATESTLQVLESDMAEGEMDALWWKVCGLRP